MSDEILKNGSKGEDVRKLQEDLNALGYQVQVDGIFGPGTEKAVKQFQAAFGYTVDGLVGKGTKFLIDQQKGYNWRVGMPTAATPAAGASAGDVAKGDGAKGDAGNKGTAGAPASKMSK